VLSELLNRQLDLAFDITALTPHKDYDRLLRLTVSSVFPMLAATRALNPLQLTEMISDS
jgi:hypothetical protein